MFDVGRARGNSAHDHQPVRGVFETVFELVRDFVFALGGFLVHGQTPEALFECAQRLVDVCGLFVQLRSVVDHFLVTLVACQVDHGYAPRIIAEGKLNIHDRMRS